MVGGGASIELVDRFCYLADMISADGSEDAAVTAVIRSGWNKFRQSSAFLIVKGIPLRLKRMVYSSSVRSCLLHGSETWPVRRENELALLWAEMRMVRQMCDVKLSHKVACEDLRDRLGLEDVVTVLQCNRLRWYGHVLRKDDSVWVKKCMDFVVEGVRPRGRPKRT